MVEKDDLTTGKHAQEGSEKPDLQYNQQMSSGGYGEETLPGETTNIPGNNISNDVRAGGRTSSGINAGNTTSQEAASMEDTGTFNDANEGDNAPSMGSNLSNSYDVDASHEMNAQPGSGLTAASSRFGDEFTETDKAILSGESGKAWVEDETTRASARFGEELASRERDLYPTDELSRPIAADDLTDDNDALTDSSGTGNISTNEHKGDDKNLWEKIKDKAEDIGEGIKKAFD
jgi:hypothetical protein